MSDAGLRRLLAGSLGPVVVAGAIGVGLVAVAAGVVLGSPLVPVVLIAAVAVGAVALFEPAVAAAVLVIVELSGFNEVVGSKGGVSLFLLATLLGVASAFIAWRRGRLQFVWSPAVLCWVLFLAVRGISGIGSPDPSMTTDWLFEMAKVTVWFYALIVLMSTDGHIATMCRIAVVCLAALAALSAAQEYVFGNASTFGGLANLAKSDVGSTTQRHTGPVGDPNFWGRNLLLWLPMALSLWADRVWPRLRWVWFGAAGLLAVGIYLSGSRGAFLAAAFGIVVWMLLAGRQYARWLLAAPLVLVVALAVPGVGSRLLTLDDASSTATQVQDPSLVGRVGAQRAGVAMFFDHPVLGVGAENFTVVEPRYLRKLGLQTTLVLAPHNLYLQMAAESGVLGLVAWLLFYGSVIFVALRLLLLTRRRLPPAIGAEAAWLAVGALAGLLAWGAASVFLHIASERVLLLMVACVVALDTRVRRRLATLDPAELQPPRPFLVLPERAALQQIVGAALAAFTIVAFPAFLIPVSNAPRWSATAAGVIEPDDGSAYGLDLLSRGTIVATYVTMVDRPEITRAGAALVGVSPAQLAATTVRWFSSQDSTILTVKVSGDDPAVVGRLPTGIMKAASNFLATYRQQFSLSPFGTESATLSREKVATLRFLLLATALGGVAAAAAAIGAWNLTTPTGRHDAPRAARGRIRIGPDRTVRTLVRVK